MEGYRLVAAIISGLVAYFLIFAGLERITGDWIVIVTFLKRLITFIANLANQLPQHQILEKAKLYAQQPHEELDGAVKDVLLWFSQSSHKQWLLIYDNVDREISAEASDPEVFNLKKYLAEADQGCILITS